MTTHELNYPSFDPNWSWSGSSVLLTTTEHLFLVKRSYDMPTHRGQMGCFAGHKKPTESHPFETAKREFAEESELPETAISCLGVLPPVFTARGQPIMPVVARLEMSTEQFLKEARSNGEWTDLIAIPWRWLQDMDRWDWGWRKGRDDQKILVIALPPRCYIHQRGETQETFILWGATARMVWQYLSLYYRPA